LLLSEVRRRSFRAFNSGSSVQKPPSGPKPQPRAGGLTNKPGRCPGISRIQNRLLNLPVNELAPQELQRLRRTHRFGDTVAMPLIFNRLETNTGGFFGQAWSGPRPLNRCVFSSIGPGSCLRDISALNELARQPRRTRQAVSFEVLRRRATRLGLPAWARIRRDRSLSFECGTGGGNSTMDSAKCVSLPLTSSGWLGGHKRRCGSAFQIKFTSAGTPWRICANSHRGQLAPRFSFLT
jgi:hypothetical protein